MAAGRKAQREICCPEAPGSIHSITKRKAKNWQNDAQAPSMIESNSELKSVMVTLGLL